MGRRNSLFGTLQHIGKALMLPVAVLPAAGLLVGLGTAALSQGWLPPGVAQVMLAAGHVILDNIPLIFALGVAIGLTGGEGTAALAALVGFMVMVTTMGTISDLTGFNELRTATGRSYLTRVMGIQTLNTGVFGAILIGMVAAHLHNRYHTIKLHPSLAFFAGKRFVPMVTALAGLGLGLVLAYVWPPVQTALDHFTQLTAQQNPQATSGLYGLLNRVLIPFGLHHIWNNPFWYSIGEYVNAAGEVVKGDYLRYLKGDPTAGLFMTGFFPVMMFGLPAAALAMVHTARKERRAQVAGILLSGALTSFLTGITEPIEFTFMFVSPLLYGLHALLTGLSFLVMNALDVHLGFSFSAGFIDYVLLWNQSSNGLLLLPVGLVYGLVYYTTFRFLILRLNLPTPGRDDEGMALPGTAADLAPRVLLALGGAQNIERLEACITRLRITLHHPEKVEVQTLRQLGAAGVVQLGNHLQVVFGMASEQLCSQLQALMAGGEPAAMVKAAPVQASSTGLFVKAPMEGKILPLSAVPDEIFSQQLMGDGFAIDPTDGEVYAPFDGRVEALFPTRHAVALKSHSGHEVLIHVGIDTVHLAGEGFVAHVQQGDLVQMGQKLLSVNLQAIRGRVPSLITPVVFPNLLPEHRLLVGDTGVSIVE